MNIDDVCRALRECEEARGKATSGPWEYRPEKNDDWGVIKSGCYPVAKSLGHPSDCITHDRRRENGTDPYIDNGQFIVTARNLPVSLAKVADHLKAVKIYGDNGRQWTDWREVEKTLTALLSDGREG